MGGTVVIRAYDMTAGRWFPDGDPDDDAEEYEPDDPEQRGYDSARPENREDEE